MTQSVLFDRAFTHFLLGRVALSLADSILTVSLGWHLYQATQNAFDLALVGLFQIAPFLGLFLVTGWVADHFSRKTIMISCASLQVVVFALIGWQMSTPDLNKWVIYGLISLMGIGKAFISPATQAVLPNLVTPGLLNRAVAVTGTSWNLALTLGPFVAGLLLAWIDRSVYWLLTGLAFVSLYGFLRLPSLTTVKTEGARRDILGGIRFLKVNPVVLGCLSLDLAIVLFGSVMVILPIYVADVLQTGPETLGLLRAMPAVGAVLIGLVLSGERGEFTHIGRTLFVSLTVFALSILLFSFSDSLWLSCLALFIYGAADMFSVVIRTSVVQTLTPDALRGRVSALNSIFIASSNQVGDFRAGSVAALVGPVGAGLIGGVMALVVAVGGGVLFSELRKLDRKTLRLSAPDQENAEHPKP